MKPKAILVALFAALLAVGLCACGQQASSSGASSSKGQTSASSSASTNSSTNSAGQQSTSNANEPEIVQTHTYATMQEVFDAPGEAYKWDANEASFGFIFKDGSKYILVRCELPQGMYDQIEAAYNANDMDTITELVAPLPVHDECTVDSPTSRQIELLEINLTVVS